MPLLQFSSPYQKLFSHSSNYQFLRVFGCLCYPWLLAFVLIPSPKFDMKSVPLYLSWLLFAMILSQRGTLPHVMWSFLKMSFHTKIILQILSPMQIVMVSLLMNLLTL